MAADKSIISMPKINPAKIRGHRPHRSGAGIHADKRTKRLRTRQAQKQFSLKGW